MNTSWDEKRIQQYIDNEIEESLTLDYKAAEALGSSPRKKKEITKDVSAMANSAGGIIIYGVREYQQPEKRHLPEKIDPIVRTDFPKERLEHVIRNIRPRVNDLIIHSVPIDIAIEHVVYVVEIEQSLVPHQATDLKYYKRFNFESAPMENYEIDDIRNRRSVLSNLINFDIIVKHHNVVYLSVKNIGAFPAQDVTFRFSPEFVWEGNLPPIFSRGIKFFPPGRDYVFRYQRIANEQNLIAFDVEVSYFHSEARRNVNDIFHIDFMDYMQSTMMKSDIQEQGEYIQGAIGSLTGEIQNLNRRLEMLPSIIGATGLDLSVTTLKNLKHILDKDNQIEKIDPYRSDLKVFQEVLGIDMDLAYKLEHFFRYPDEKEKLDGIKGMTQALLKKLNEHFKI